VTPPSLNDVVHRIQDGPSGEKVGVFLEVDRTVISGSVADAFRPAPRRRSAMNTEGNLGALRGEALDTLEEVAERIFAQKIGARVRRQARDLIDAHRRMGHTLVLVSSEPRFRVEPIARNLCIEHIVCSEVEVSNGLLTGRWSGAGPVHGAAKTAAVRDFVRRRKLTSARCYGYADGTGDTAVLDAVGDAAVVNPDESVSRTAGQRGWRTIDLEDPPRRGLREAIATVAGISAMNVGLAIGFGIGALRNDHQLGADLGISVGLQSYLALTGVKVDVVGRENMFACRPCVFAMNHQSALDAFILAVLAQGGLSAMGKKEAKYVPPAYLIGRALNTVWVDRNNSEAARISQAELASRIRDGLSVMIAPEGTRQPTPVLGPFRTGAFHVARDAGVPVVPVIMRNAFDLQPGSALTTHPGLVQVAVLEPIPTDDWTTATMRQHVAEVRQKFVDTLNRWPGEDR
jgi:putative phosphoserine phosphatase / 1-acylglycerol-3-phosphate O-acyltransferase